MLHIVCIELRFHRNALLPEDLMILRTGQRSQAEKFDNIERKLPLYDRDITPYAIGCIRREAEDVARKRDDVFDFVAKRVDLDHQAERNPVLLPEVDQAIEDRFPLLVAREIVVGDEEFVDALPPVEAHEMLHVVGRAVARLAALHVDDRAERALVRAAAARIETRAQTESTCHIP